MTERLTEIQSAGYDLKELNSEWCNKYCEKQKAYTCNECGIYQAIQKLAHYEDLDEQGLLLQLPCKVGDTIYVNGILGVGEMGKYRVIRVDYHSNLATKRSEFYIEALLMSNPTTSIGFYDKEIGKTVFLTKAEAEQNLKEINKENQKT